MTNQMKKILMICLVLSYVNFAGLSIIFIVSGFSFSYVITYVFWALSVALCVYFQYLQIIIAKEDKEFAQQIFYAKKLLELRELAKLRFYKSRGLEPMYNEDGTVMDPDTFIGILTKLDENGNLVKSIYEILGIEPVFDKDGNEVPVIVVLKHLMKKPRTSKFSDIKGLSKKMVLKGTEKSVSKDDKASEKKKAQAKAPQTASKVKFKKDVPAVYAAFVRPKPKSSDKKVKKNDNSSGENQEKKNQASAVAQNTAGGNNGNRGNEPVVVARSVNNGSEILKSVETKEEQNVAIME